MSQPIDIGAERFGLPQTVMNRIVRVLAAIAPIEQATPYASEAKGICRADSDIDLAIVGSQFTEVQLLEMETRLDDLLLPHTIHITRFESIANPDLIDGIHRVEKTFCEGPQRMGGEP